MNLRIFQVNHERDVNRVAFESFSRLKHWQGTEEVMPKIYDKVYEGQIEGKNLEAVYERFNLNKPADYMGHSMSVSDVIAVEGSEEIEDGYYYCDTFGFVKIEFDESKTSLQDYEELPVHPAYSGWSRPELDRWNTICEQEDIDRMYAE